MVYGGASLLPSGRPPSCCDLRWPSLCTRIPAVSLWGLQSCGIRAPPLWPQLTSLGCYSLHVTLERTQFSLALTLGVSISRGPCWPVPYSKGPASLLCVQRVPLWWPIDPLALPVVPKLSSLWAEAVIRPQSYGQSRHVHSSGRAGVTRGVTRSHDRANRGAETVKITWPTGTGVGVTLV